MFGLELDRLCAVQLELAIERLSFKFIWWLRKYKSPYLESNRILLEISESTTSNPVAFVDSAHSWDLTRLCVDRRIDPG